MAAKKPKFRNSEDLFYGSETKTWDLTKSYSSQIIALLTWYNDAVSTSKKNEWLKQYLKEKGLKLKIGHIPDIKLNQIGALSRMVQLGFPLSQKHKDVIVNTVMQYQVNEIKVEKPKSKVRKEVPAALVNAYTEYDNTIDKLQDGQRTFTAVKIDGLTATHVKEIKDYLLRLRDELINVDIVKDCYATPKVAINRIVKYINEVIALYAVVRKTRVAKVAKLPSKEKMVKYVKFLKESIEYKVKSIDPINIIKAKKVYLFNTKTRQIQVYSTSDSEGLSIKGTTIQNFNSSEGKTLRKPSETLHSFLGKAHAKHAKLFKEIKSVGRKLSGRINKDTIILNIA